MIQIVLQDKDIRNLERILAELFSKKLLINASISEETKYQPIDRGNFLKFKQYSLTGISRSTLRNEIMEAIQESNRSQSLEFYSVPIIDMDWSKSNTIKGHFDHVKLVS